MTKTMLIATMMASFGAQASIIEKSGVLYLTDASPSYPVVLENGGELADHIDGYLYRNHKAQFDIGGYFDDPRKICVTFHQTPDTYNGIRSIILSAHTSTGGKIYDETFSNGEEGIEECRTYNYHPDLKTGFSYWEADLYSLKSTHSGYIQNIQVDNITVTVKGFDWNPTEPTLPPSNCSEGSVFVDAIEHSVNPVNTVGDYLTCQLEPNITYEMTIDSPMSESVHNDVSAQSFKNVGMVFNSETGQRMIDTVDSSGKTYITTDGEVSFFYADENSNNGGGAVVNFKRTNLD